jgi:two-component system NtrC family sensor kinase
MVGRKVPDEPFFRVAAGRDIYVSNIMPSALNGAPVFVISAPVGLPETVSGVLVGTVKLGYFTSSSVDGVRFGETGYAFIMDANGNVVAHPDKDRIFTRDPGSLFRKDVIRVLKKVNQLGLTVGITAPVEEILAPSKKIRKRMILVTIAVSVLVVTMVSIFVTHYVTTPIRKFVRGLKTVTAGNLDDEIKIETTDEFSRMARSFNEMARALKQSKMELKQTYQQLVQKEKMAALGELTARIAHEIKNPLGIIKGSAQILLEESERPEIKSEVTRYIIEEIDHLSVRIQGLLSHTRPMLLNLEPADLNQLLEDRIHFWESQRTHLQNVSIVRKYEPELPLMNLDKGLIKQLVMNIVINASEAMPEGGVLTVTTDIAGNGRKRQRQELIEAEGVVLIFEDTGCGIPQQDLPRIFDPFFTTKENGTGLGLSTVYRILEQHQAKIQVKSTVGKGTCFIIMFPTNSEYGG